MKREFIILGLMIVMIGLVAISMPEANTNETVAKVNYNHIQEQQTDSNFNSPVINQTANQVKDVLVG